MADPRKTPPSPPGEDSDLDDLFLEDLPEVEESGETPQYVDASCQYPPPEEQPRRQKRGHSPEPYCHHCLSLGFPLILIRDHVAEAAIIEAATNPMVMPFFCMGCGRLATFMCNKCEFRFCGVDCALKCGRRRSQKKNKQGCCAEAAGQSAPSRSGEEAQGEAPPLDDPQPRVFVIYRNRNVEEGDDSDNEVIEVYAEFDPFHPELPDDNDHPDPPRKG